MTPNKFPLTFRQRKLLLILLYSLSTCIFLGSMILSAEHVNFVNKAVKNSGIGLKSERLWKDFKILLLLTLAALIVVSITILANMTSANRSNKAYKSDNREAIVILGPSILIVGVLELVLEAKYAYVISKSFDRILDEQLYSINFLIMLICILPVGLMLWQLAWQKDPECREVAPNVISIETFSQKVDNYKKKRRNP